MTCHLETENRIKKKKEKKMTRELNMWAEFRWALYQIHKRTKTTIMDPPLNSTSSILSKRFTT